MSHQRLFALLQQKMRSFSKDRALFHVSLIPLYSLDSFVPRGADFTITTSEKFSIQHPFGGQYSATRPNYLLRDRRYGGRIITRE
jgi:hypothetical protein